MIQDSLDYKQYYNKVLGGWIGKCAGGILGAPIEGFKNFNTIPFTEELFATNFANDDLDLQVLWLDMLLKKGHKVRATDLNAHWKNHVDFPWCEYGIATRNINIGLDNPNTGNHNNWYWNTGMGSPIRSEIWGMVSPGQPEKAALFAGMDSELDHFGFSVEAEQYLAACASIAFFENDLKTILEQGLNYLPADSECAIMVKQVFAWNEKHEFDVVAGKIKSFYGDADFTNSPMNVAFTILSLLHSNNSFDFLIDAFHLGHDSDCVVATAGALLGIVLGFDAIPEVWKTRVGNELLVSPEIVNIYCPKTITELTELTCKAGINFIDDAAIISNYPKGILYEGPEKLYDVHCDVQVFPKLEVQKGAVINIVYENLTNKPQNVKLELVSPYFTTEKIQLSVAANTIAEHLVAFNPNGTKFSTAQTKIPYSLKVELENGAVETFDKGFPYYGNWLLLGPFIEEDKSIIKSTSPYPDHGMSSLPSVKYMNQDLARSPKAFLTTEIVESLINTNTVFDQAFHAQVVHPSEMRMNLKDYFYGIGERSIYLYSEIDASEASKKWLSMGSPNYLTVWHNGNEVFKNEELVRSYPLAHNVELDLVAGKNALLIRIDAVLDDFTFEIGLKEHDNKHPHQCLWNTDLQFDIINNLKL
ncbi:ADP-ribosylglycohydrolase family protein [Tamlana sp. I1]|uniref:ADP-ribosylglycohydrolase family protein n=1 Tax=Tamlana sp. I1 TaxID=2762061 RepID=UPI0018903E7D|nr:ADP-ribosylglycohydrolase family protein [Tamlana sp. I1]